MFLLPLLQKLKVKFWLYQPHGWCVLLLKCYSKSSHQSKLTKFCSCSVQSLLVPNIKFDPRQWENLSFFIEFISWISWIAQVKSTGRPPINPTIWPRNIQFVEVTSAPWGEQWGGGGKWGLLGILGGGNDIFYTCFQTWPLGRNYVIIT